MLRDVEADVIVCGHSQRQFDRHVLGKRLLNAGAVGMPYEGIAGAFSLLLGPDAELRRTDYDIDAMAIKMRASGFPDVDSAMLRDSLLDPADPDQIADRLERNADRRHLRRSMSKPSTSGATGGARARVPSGAGSAWGWWGEAGAGGDHRRATGVDCFDDLAGVDALQVDRGHA
jgi:hypothetical protein